jgi:hypothetical protein
VKSLGDRHNPHIRIVHRQALVIVRRLLPEYPRKYFPFATEFAAGLRAPACDLPVTHEEWLRFQAKGEIDFARQGIPLAISQLILTNSPGIAAITGGTAAITVSWISS